MKTFRITIQIDTDWVKDEDDLRTLLDEECNLWSVTHCREEIEVQDVTPPQILALTAEKQEMLQGIGKSWKWCGICKRRGKPKNTLATRYCDSCLAVYCADCGSYCTCRMDD